MHFFIICFPCQVIWFEDSSVQLPQSTTVTKTRNPFDKKGACGWNWNGLNQYNTTSLDQLWITARTSGAAGCLSPGKTLLVSGNINKQQAIRWKWIWILQQGRPAWFCLAPKTIVIGLKICKQPRPYFFSYPIRGQTFLRITVCTSSTAISANRSQKAPVR